jgi:exopolyphosphatase/guanosine-5'-triphosphate,3'-diphosphate pyrophosphatase
MHRYHVDVPQARRVHRLAVDLYKQLGGIDAHGQAQLSWASRLHEIGISVAYSSYHRHSAYIVANADMPGFTREEQHRIAQLLLGHRRSLKKILPEMDESTDWRGVFALRVAVLLCQRRTASNPRIESARAGDNKFRLAIDPAWVLRNPLTNTVLKDEIREWEKIGFDVKISGLYETDEGTDMEAAD